MKALKEVLAGARIHGEVCSSTNGPKALAGSFEEKMLIAAFQFAFRPLTTTSIYRHPQPDIMTTPKRSTRRSGRRSNTPLQLDALPPEILSRICYFFDLRPIYDPGNPDISLEEMAYLHVEMHKDGVELGDMINPNSEDERWNDAVDSLRALMRTSRKFLVCDNRPENRFSLLTQSTSSAFSLQEIVRPVLYRKVSLYGPVGAISGWHAANTTIGTSPFLFTHEIRINPEDSLSSDRATFMPEKAVSGRWNSAVDNNWSWRTDMIQPLTSILRSAKNLRSITFAVDQSDVEIDVTPSALLLAIHTITPIPPLTSLIGIVVNDVNFEAFIIALDSVAGTLRELDIIDRELDDILQFGPARKPRLLARLQSLTIATSVETKSWILPDLVASWSLPALKELICAAPEGLVPSPEDQPARELLKLFQSHGGAVSGFHLCSSYQNLI